MFYQIFIIKHQKMGNNPNFKEYGDIAIQTDQPIYFPGDYVSGCVFLNLKI
jgi:hypothetical protein